MPAQTPPLAGYAPSRCPAFLLSGALETNSPVEGYKALAVSETDELNELAHAAIQQLREKLKNGRTVKAEAKRLAHKMHDSAKKGPGQGRQDGPC